jgi:hypothetical protein
MPAFLTVAAEHCRQVEHSLQLAGGIFKIPKVLLRIVSKYEKTSIGSIANPVPLHYFYVEKGSLKICPCCVRDERDFLRNNTHAGHKPLNAPVCRFCLDGKA